MAKQSGWVTINGVHVFIDKKSGKITQGPAKFIGSTLNDLPSSKSSQAEKSPVSKAMAKVKSDREADPSMKKKADGLVDRAKRQTATNDKEIKPYTQNEGMSGRLKESVKKRNVESTANKKAELASPEKASKSTPTNSIDNKIGDYKAKLDSLYSEQKGILDKLDVKDDPKLSKRLSQLNKEIISAERDKAKLVTQKRRSSLMLGKDTDYSKLTKSEIQKGMKEIEREIKIEQSTYKDPYMISAFEDIWGKADLALGNKSYAKSSPKNSPKTGSANFDNATNADKVKVVKNPNVKSSSSTPRTGNSNFDNATKSNKATSGKSSSGLTVTHYDGVGRGSWNEYRINGKRVSAKEARAQFPNMFGSNGRYNGGKK